MRWPIEQCFEECKNELGLDHYEGRSWNAWYRHTLLVFVAQLFLTRLRLKYKKNACPDPFAGKAARGWLSVFCPSHKHQRLYRARRLSHSFSVNTQFLNLVRVLCHNYNLNGLAVTSGIAPAANAAFESALVASITAGIAPVAICTNASKNVNNRTFSWEIGGHLAH